jgi:hypothetical protein
LLKQPATAGAGRGWTRSPLRLLNYLIKASHGFVYFIHIHRYVPFDITFQIFAVLRKIVIWLALEREGVLYNRHPNSFALKAFGAQQASFDCPDASGIAEG